MESLYLHRPLFDPDSLYQVQSLTGKLKFLCLKFNVTLVIKEFKRVTVSYIVRFENIENPLKIRLF